MKKTSVLIEVSEDLYQDIVEPAKKSKSFSKLVVKLLEAYWENDSIYSYINGSLDGLREEENEELLKSLNSMQESLSMIDVLGNQAETLMEEGLGTFSDIGGTDYEVSKAESGIDRADTFLGLGSTDRKVGGTINTTRGTSDTLGVTSDTKEQVSGISREEVEEIVAETVSKSLSGIESMLSRLMESNLNINQPKGVLPEESEEIDIFDNDVIKPKEMAETPIVTEVAEEPSRLVLAEYEEDDLESAKEAESAISSLLDSISY